MSGKQREISPGKVSTATLSVPALCVVGLARWERRLRNYIEVELGDESMLQAQYR